MPDVEVAPDDCRRASSSSAFLMHSICSCWPVRFLQTCLASSSDLDSCPRATPPEVLGSGEIVGLLRRVGCVPGVDGDPLEPASDGTVPCVVVASDGTVLDGDGTVVDGDGTVVDCDGVVLGEVVDVCAMAIGRPAPITKAPAVQRVCSFRNISVSIKDGRSPENRQTSFPPFKGSRRRVPSRHASGTSPPAPRARRQDPAAPAASLRAGADRGRWRWRRRWTHARSSGCG